MQATPGSRSTRETAKIEMVAEYAKRPVGTLDIQREEIGERANIGKSTVFILPAQSCSDVLKQGNSFQT